MNKSKLKSTDFMVGDWVQWKDKYVQIAAISGIVYSFGHIDVELAHCGSGLIERHDLKSISPIPLTHSILEANGFEEEETDEDNVYTLNKCDDTGYYEIEIHWIDSYDNGAADAFNHVQWDECWKINIESEGSYNKGWCKTIYFHELQHALRLCGLHELADNFKVE